MSAKLAGLPSRSPQAMRLRYDKAGLGPDGVLLPERGHNELRRILAREVRDAVEEVTRRLAATLAEIAGGLADKAAELLWGMPEVRKKLFGEERDHNRFEHGLSTLFLRFARPAVSLFVETPRLSKGRELLVAQHQREIALLQGYYDGADKKRKNLEMFLTVGEWVAAAAGPGPTAAAGAVKLAANHFEERRKTWSEPADFEQVRRQIESDLDALATYLSDSVVEAAAFYAYCQQELDRVKDRFERAEEESAHWQACVRAALRRGHPPVVEAFGAGHQEREYRRAIVISLDELRSLLSRQA
jgi:sulfur relay (sulfurtransferase) complex TusBCD TusD component (DsrE family)